MRRRFGGPLDVRFAGMKASSVMVEASVRSPARAPAVMRFACAWLTMGAFGASCGGRSTEVLDRGGNDGASGSSRASAGRPSASSHAGASGTPSSHGTGGTQVSASGGSAGAGAGSTAGTFGTGIGAGGGHTFEIAGGDSVGPGGGAGAPDAVPAAGISLMLSPSSVSGASCSAGSTGGFTYVIGSPPWSVVASGYAGVSAACTLQQDANGGLHIIGNIAGTFAFVNCTTGE